MKNLTVSAVLLPTGSAENCFAFPLTEYSWRVSIDEQNTGDPILSSIASSVLQNAGINKRISVHSTIPPNVGLGEKISAAVLGASLATKDPVFQAKLARKVLQKKLGRPMSHGIQALIQNSSSFALRHFPLPLFVQLPPFKTQLFSSAILIPTLPRFTPYRPSGKLDRRRTSDFMSKGGAIVGGFFTQNADLVAKALEDHDVNQKLGPIFPGFFPAQNAAINVGAQILGFVGGGPALFLMASDQIILKRAIKAILVVMKVHRMKLSIHMPFEP